MRKILVLLVGAALVLAAPPASAADFAQQQRIVVSPGSTDIAVDPGSSVTKSVTVVNKGEKSVTVEFSTAPYRVEGESYAPLYSQTPGVVDASAWIRFTGLSEPALLKPQEVREVSYIVQIPSTAKPGGYTAAVFVTSSPEVSGGAVVVHDRVAVPQYITVKGDVHASGAAEAAPIPFVLWGGKLQMPYVVTNTGEGHFTAKVAVTVTAPWRATVYEVTDERYVLPGTKRLMTLEWQPRAIVGIYKVEQSAEYLGQTHTLSSHWIVLIYPEMLIGIIFLVLGTIWLIVVRRKNH